MICSTCAAELQGAKKFCGQCGAPVARPAIDPFATTVQPAASAGSGAAPRSNVSPLASSSIEFTGAVRELVVAEAVPAVPKSASGTLAMKQVPPAKAPSVVPPSFGVSSSPHGALGPGMAVRVRWADGQSYPGTVWQLHGTQVLVAFTNGQRHWVEAAFVERV